MKDKINSTVSFSANQASDRYDQHFTLSFEYPVYFTKKMFDPANAIFNEVLTRVDQQQRNRLVVFIDSGVAETHPGISDAINKYFQSRNTNAAMVCDVQIVPGGKASKTSWDVTNDTIALLEDLRLDRQSVVIAIGGGSVLDAVGFAVSLVHRGLRLIRVPTTTLAQADAGIGIKNGLDIRGKNRVGTFTPPFAVINDFEFLATLSFDDWIGGIAEAFKVAIIKDKVFFDYLCEKAQALKNREPEVMENLIRRCALLHLEHIRTCGDPFELGSARPLDFGHWAGHKLEVISDYAIGHGQTVAMGIALDSFYAMKTDLLDEPQLKKILDGFVDCGFEICTDELTRRHPNGELIIMDGLAEFQEHLGGRLTVPLPKGIGSMVEIHDVETDIVAQGVRYLQEYQNTGKPHS